MNRAWWVVAASAGLIAGAVPARAQLNLAANAGTVRYETAPSTSSFAFNPELTLPGRRSLLDLTGSATTASDGSRSVAGGATVWGATPPVAGHLQLDGLLQGVYTSPRGDSSSYALTAFAEGAYAGDGAGFGIGAGVLRGGITGLPALNAVRGSARGWLGVGPVSLTLAVQPTLLSTKVWFTDFTAGAEVDPGHGEISGSAQLRQSPTTGLDLGGELSLVYHLTPVVALAASAGRYLRDPFQGLPEGFHINVGAVLTVWRPHAAETEGVEKGDLTDFELQSLGVGRGLGNSVLRTNPATSKGLSGSSGSSFGRGHHL